jgi:hypothetical protein
MITQQLAVNHPDRLLTATIMSSTHDPKVIGAAATGGGGVTQSTYASQGSWLSGARSSAARRT